MIFTLFSASSTFLSVYFTIFSRRPLFLFLCVYRFATDPIFIFCNRFTFDLPPFIDFPLLLIVIYFTFSYVFSFSFLSLLFFSLKPVSAIPLPPLMNLLFPHTLSLCLSSFPPLKLSLNLLLPWPVSFSSFKLIASWVFCQCLPTETGCDTRSGLTLGTRTRTLRPSTIFVQAPETITLASVATFDLPL